MSIIVAVKKAGGAVIAADTISTFGETKVSSAYTRKRSKILRCGDSFLGVSGAAAHNNVVASVIENYPNELVLTNIEEIFKTSLKLHEILKEEYFINTAEDEKDAYESSQIDLLIVNPHGIFGLYSWREVYEFDRFWANGSGMEYALGAMFAVYDLLDNAQQIAEIGVKAACEFDTGCGLPLTVHAVELSKTVLE